MFLLPISHTTSARWPLRKRLDLWCDHLLIVVRDGNGTALHLEPRDELFQAWDRNITQDSYKTDELPFLSMPLSEPPEHRGWKHRDSGSSQDKSTGGVES